MNTDCDRVTGLILAGGRATRMKNCDKGLQQFNGKSMIENVIGRFAPQVSALLINANRNLEAYGKFGHPVYSDFKGTSKEPEYDGPLAGMVVGLNYCKTPYMVSVPCDTPFLPMNLVAKLMDALQQQCADIAIACTGDIANSCAQPVFCLLKTTLREQLSRYLAAGGRRMDGWYGESNIARVYFEDENEFRNINTLEELHSFDPTST